MKNIFEIVVIIFITLSVFVCLIIFSEEVLIRQEVVHLRNRIDEIIEINSGYTDDAEIKINNMLNTLNYDVEINVDKKDRLEFGEELKYTLTVFSNRKLPFINSENYRFSYTIKSSYYNIN